MLIVDGSETINQNDQPGEPSSFSILQSVLVRLTKQFSISNQSVLMGLIQFSNITSVPVPLGSIDNGVDMEQAILDVTYQNGEDTLTGQALGEGAMQLQSFGREGARKQIILLTDGAPTRYDFTLREAARIRNFTHIITVGINLVASTQETLMAISSDNAVITANNVQELDNEVEEIIRSACPGILLISKTITLCMSLLCWSTKLMLLYFSNSCGTVIY